MDWDRLESQLDRGIRSSGLAEPCAYTPASGQAQGIRGVLEIDPIEIDVETQVMVRSTQPRFSVYRGDLSVEPAQGDVLEMRGVTYQVVDIERTGDWYGLRLHAV